jgi:hypothetical protein
VGERSGRDCTLEFQDVAVVATPISANDEEDDVWWEEWEGRRGRVGMPRGEGL